MTGFLIFIGIIVVIVITVFVIAAATIWLDKATDPCLHSYERIDTDDDKKMILVCRRCGKIKKLRK